MKLKKIKSVILISFIAITGSLAAAPFQKNLFHTGDVFSGTSVRKEPLTLVLNRGDNLVEVLTQFVKDNHLKSGTFVGIGALENVKLSYYHRDVNSSDSSDVPRYIDKVFNDGPYELLSMTGNIAWKENESSGRPMFHNHVTLGDRNYNVIGGHLKEATVAVTTEITIIPTTTRYVRSQKMLSNDPAKNHKELFLLDYETE